MNAENKSRHCLSCSPPRRLAADPCATTVLSRSIQAAGTPTKTEDRRLRNSWRSALTFLSGSERVPKTVETDPSAPVTKIQRSRWCAVDYSFGSSTGPFSPDAGPPDLYYLKPRLIGRKPKKRLILPWLYKPTAPNLGRDDRRAANEAGGEEGEGAAGAARTDPGGHDVARVRAPLLPAYRGRRGQPLFEELEQAGEG